MDLSKISKKYINIILLLANLLFLIVTINIFDYQLITNDDWVIANIYSGAFGEGYISDNAFVVSTILGKLMVFLYSLVHQINWFIFIQLIIVFISVVSLEYIVVDKNYEMVDGKTLVIIIAIAIVVISPIYMKIQYTKSAAIGSISGLIVSDYCMQKKKYIGGVLGLLFCLMASLFRFSCFYLILPAYGIVILRQLKKKILRLKQILLFCIIGVIVVALANYQKKINSSEYYREYQDFSSARAKIVDYYCPEYEELQDNYISAGISKSTFNLIKEWTFIDYDVMDVKLFNKIASINSDYTKSNITYFSRLKGFICERVDVTNPRFYDLYVSISIIMIFILLAREKIYLLITCLLEITLELYFYLYIGRLPRQVESAIAISCLFVALYIFDYEDIKIKKYKKTKSLIIIIFFTLVMIDLLFDYKQMYKRNEQKDALAFYEMINSKKDNIYYIPIAESGEWPALRYAYSNFITTPENIYANVISMGSWLTRMPWLDAKYEDAGINNPIENITDSNVYIIGNDILLYNIENYYYEKYGVNIERRLVSNKYNISIYKMTIVN